MLMNYADDGTRIYICAFDAERGVMVYLVDVGGKDPAFAGDWETIPAEWIEKVSSFTDYHWNMDNTPYDIQRSKDGGRHCVAAFPIRDENQQNCAYLMAELSINSVILQIIHYALKVGAVSLALTLLIALFVGMRIKKMVADPISSITNAAETYVQDRKNGIDRSGHFSSLGILTGNELENLTNTMANMEDELIKHEDQIEALLDSLVKSMSIAIDERSHHTGNHTQNMALMAEAYLDWIEKTGNAWQYDETRRRVFLMSVGLHDIGKLTVPLEIMDKATRLGSALGPIRERFTKLNLLNRIALLEGRISEAEYTKNGKEAGEDLAFILRVNTAGYLSDGGLDRISDLAARTFTDENGEARRLLTDGEITMLSIRKGTLTTEERNVMQGHASSTWNILKQVQFPAQYAYIPLWAASHHELLQGNGYPNGYAGKDISREVRLLTILDIFEALTAKDRPYKPSYSISRALEILDSMVREGSLDGELLASFRESRAWEVILPPEQEPDPAQED